MIADNSQCSRLNVLTIFPCWVHAPNDEDHEGLPTCVQIFHSTMQNPTQHSFYRVGRTAHSDILAFQFSFGNNMKHYDVCKSFEERTKKKASTYVCILCSLCITIIVLLRYLIVKSSILDVLIILENHRRLFKQDTLPPRSPITR